MIRSNETTYVSVQLTLAEKEILDAAVKKSGKTRNRFIRDWIAELWERPT